MNICVGGQKVHAESCWLPEPQEKKHFESWALMILLEAALFTCRFSIFNLSELQHEESSSHKSHRQCWCREVWLNEAFVLNKLSEEKTIFLKEANNNNKKNLVSVLQEDHSVHYW